MTRRGRRTRRARPGIGSATIVSAPAYIKRQLPFFDPLDEEQLIKIENQLDWMFENIGFAFRDDPEAIRIWKESGVRMVGDKVFVDASWVREQCAKAPSEYIPLPVCNQSAKRIEMRAHVCPIL